jgi:hypothetical protein
VRLLSRGTTWRTARPLSLLLAVLLGGAGVAGCSGTPRLPRAFVASAASMPATSAFTATSASTVAWESSESTGGLVTVSASGDSGYLVSYRDASATVAAGPLLVSYPVVTVSGPVPAVRAQAQRRITGLVTRFRAGVLAQLDSGSPAPGQPFTETITVATEVRWGWLYSVRMADDVDLGGAHPATDVGAITIDLRTGDEVLPGDLFPQLPPVDRQVRKALVKLGLPSAAVGPVTVAHIPPSEVATPAASYPTPTGLAVALPQCGVGACASGVPSVLVPWRSLPAPRKGALPPTTG